jgi:hypothetical protein
MNPDVIKWAIRHDVSLEALQELKDIFGIDHVPCPSEKRYPSDGFQKDEAFTQSLVRLEASHKGLRLWRNNVGALLDKRGVPVRYGLGNDSPALNKIIKSADLIGWRPLLITDALVGSTIAQFLSRECKRPGWKFTGDEHETAQLKWAELVIADGGDAGFCTGEGSL